jgi:hypothetical protein
MGLLSMSNVCSLAPFGLLTRPVVEGDNRSSEVIMPTQDVRQATIAQRLCEVRQEVFGTDGGPVLAAALHLPARTWRSYEAGANIPARVLLRFSEISGASLLWLLTGEGGRFADRGRSGVAVGRPS